MLELVLSLVILLGVFVYRVANLIDSLHYSCKVMGTVTSCEKRFYKHISYKIQYTFTVNGEVYYGSTDKAGMQVVGRSIPIRYIPNRPNLHKTCAEFKLDVFWVVLFVIAFLMFAGIGYMEYNNIHLPRMIY